MESKKLPTENEQKAVTLFVKNIPPPSLTDSALTKIFPEYGGSDSKVIERPIVEFSLETRAAIKAKEKRAEKSREKNFVKPTTSKNEAMKKKQKKKDIVRDESEDPDQLPSYSGLTAKAGISSLPSVKPKGKISRKNLKPSKPKGKKKLQSRRNREPQMKPKIKVTDSVQDSRDLDSVEDTTKENDAVEGKTLFIRNLEFDIIADELKTFFSAYGTVNYVVIGTAKLTEHPERTAFVMFRDAADANKCLAEFQIKPWNFHLAFRQFNISLALITKEDKDKINLYLARKRFIRPGSNSAIGVSAVDINRQTAVQRVNMSIFTSDTRLCIHNLPPSLTDSALREIFSKHAGSGSKVIEARVMRDLQDKDLNGIGKSEEYGFVSFSTHEHALMALRAIDNNPKIFTPSSRRPIVMFALENRAAIEAKEKRGNESEDPDPLPSYSGLTAKAGISSLPGLKPKGKISRKNLKHSKPKGKKKLQSRRNRKPQVKPKIEVKDSVQDSRDLDSEEDTTNEKRMKLICDEEEESEDGEDDALAVAVVGKDYPERKIKPGKSESIFDGYDSDDYSDLIW